ncbi:MAG: RHS repeat-associated core domain-containing protein, partial [Acidobacteriota bacterium]
SSITYPQFLHAECPPGSMPPRTVSYDYTRGYLSAVPSYASAVSYQLGGMVKSVTHANGVTENITPAPANLSRPGSIATSGVADGNSWSTGTYVYDGAGNIKSIGEQTFRYDGLNRLVHGEVNLGGDDPLVQSASYDNYGNLTALSTAGMNLATAVGTNRLVAGTYDAAGNLTDIVQNGVDFDYRYDALNMMTSLQSTNDQARIFIYDADDERLVTFDCVGTTQCSQDSRTTFTVRDLDGRVLRVFEDLPGEPWTWERDYVYRGSQLLASVEPDTSGGERTLHLHLDHLGTPRQVTGPGAIEVSRHHYFPFGDEATDPLQDEVALKFTGHERDENGGAGVLDYMHARYCSPVLGRFASIDPILSADPAKPQSWNKYSYAASNPLRFIDPTGLYICEGAETDCLFVADAVNAIEDAIIGLSDASEAEMLALQQALEFFGNPGEENGVVIVISEVEGGSMSARYNRRKRLNRINVTLDLYDVQVEGSAAHRAELAAGLVHEADHGLQQRQLGRMWGDLETVIGAEITATSRQAIVYRGLKHPSSTGMWSPKNGYDFNAILKWSESSVASFCRTSKACSR